MAVLGNARHEAAARVIVGGGSAEDAAAAAGYKTEASSFASNARKFIQREDIQERVRELHAEIAAKLVETTADITAEWIEERFRKIADFPVKEAKASDVNVALRELGKFKGFYAPEKVAPTNPAGDQPYDPNAVSDEDRVKRILELFGKVKGAA